MINDHFEKQEKNIIILHKGRSCCGGHLDFQPPLTHQGFQIWKAPITRPFPIQKKQTIGG
jgi:hypothetical protein